MSKHVIDYNNPSHHTPQNGEEEYMENKGSLWMRPSYIGGSEYQPQEDSGFMKNPKYDSIINNQNKGLFNRIRDTEY